MCIRDSVRAFGQQPGIDVAEQRRKAVGIFERGAMAAPVDLQAVGRELGQAGDRPGKQGVLHTRQAAQHLSLRIEHLHGLRPWQQNPDHGVVTDTMRPQAGEYVAMASRQQGFALRLGQRDGRLARLG